MRTEALRPSRRRRSWPDPPRLRRFLSLKPELELLTVEGTEALILDAARRCIVQYGAGKLSMVDVARVSKLSRRSVYNHFPERDVLVAAVGELAFSSFAADMDDAMAAAATLEDQMVAAAGTVRRWHHALRGTGGALLDEDEAARLIIRGSALMMRRMIEVVKPYLDAADDRGELRPGVDTGLAAEWVSRILHSLSVSPGVGFDPDDPDQLEEFIRAHLLLGFAALTPARRRATIGGRS